jgi:lipopolysaccharide biosynthesis regulator YciM
MQTTNKQFIEMNQAICELAQTLAQSEARHDRAMRRQRWLLLGLLTLLATLFCVSKQSGSIAFAQEAPPSTAQADPQTRTQTRKVLVAQLPEEARQRLETFEQEVNWVHQYMQTWDKGMEGAVVALMLSKMAKSMEAVPKMQNQMEVMNSLMGAMPVMASEMRGMNANIAVITANMGVMTHDMDSTMGRMGRSMPWMPW